MSLYLGYNATQPTKEVTKGEKKTINLLDNKDLIILPTTPLYSTDGNTLTNDAHTILLKEVGLIGTTRTVSIKLPFKGSSTNRWVKFGRFKGVRAENICSVVYEVSPTSSRGGKIRLGYSNNITAHYLTGYIHDEITLERGLLSPTLNMSKSDVLHTTVVKFFTLNMTTSLRSVDLVVHVGIRLPPH